MYKLQITSHKSQINTNWRSSQGFTVVELLVVMGIAALLFALVSMNFLDARTQTAITTTSDSFISDLKSQQTKAMIGDTEGRDIPDAYGVYIKPTGYVLFHGTWYNPADPDNFEITAEDVRFSTSFSGESIVFATRSGVLLNFVDGENQITVQDTTTTQQKTIDLNMLGTVTAIN